MFARYFLELPLPAELVEETLLRDPDDWLGAIAQRAGDRGERLLADVGIGDRVRIDRSVSLRLGEPIRAATATIVPVSWRATGATAGMFPTMEADIEVAPLDGGTTQLAISARYLPPLGRVGKILDRAIMHRIAEATIKDFLDRVGEAIEASSGQDHRSPSPAR